ncbi:isopentenyl-diphosphate Delta-isomerase [Pseudomonas sp. RL_105y_Pfl1_103]|uniref:isopentenyl-diphosphate Delta-isomerase n=1 Tax=Pseudomonas sp. RL_105y_Pfl1_103 TaxID=3088707 RepID=UPI0030DD3054
MEDVLILVDVNDQPTGFAGKQQVHEEGLLHRAFSIFIFDPHSRLLLQQRADSKYHSAGLWSNTCCGHPRQGETTPDAARRRLYEEMGLTCELEQYSTLVYRERVSKTMTEYEYDHVFVGCCATDPIANPDEAKAWRWVEPEQLQDELQHTPKIFTAWLRTIVKGAGAAGIKGWAPKAQRALQTPIVGGAFELPRWLAEAHYPLNPYAEEAQHHTRQWLKSIGLEDTPRAARQLDIYVPGTYAGYMWPDAPRHLLLILSDVVGWFSCQDDLADEDCKDPHTLEQLLRGVHSSAFTCYAPQPGLLASGLKDIIRRSARLAPPLWKERAGERYASYIAPCMTALMHRVHHTQPGIEGYDSLWRDAGGFQFCLEFIYWVQNIYLPSSLYYSKPWQELCLLALNLFKAVNDLLSFRIMEDPDDDIYNLLTHLRHTQGYSPEAAAREVSRRIDQWAHAFTDAQERLPACLASYGYDEQSVQQMMICAQALHNQWRGNIAWHLTAPRYREIRFENLQGETIDPHLVDGFVS